MNIYISTNMFNVDEIEEVFDILENTKDENIGIELFTEFHNLKFAEVVNKNIDKLKKYKVSLHGPYYKTEHSAPNGCEIYNKSKEYFINTLKLSKELNSPYIVYHHNNCKINNKEYMIKNSKTNLEELNELAKEYNANIVIENAGVISNNNMLFDQEEFITLCKESSYDVLIDIGHAFANGWDLEYIIRELKEKIVSYHLHNNNGEKDLHHSLSEGKLDMEEFFEIYKQYTNKADLVLEFSKEYRDKTDVIVKDVNYIKSKIIDNI